VNDLARLRGAVFALGLLTQLPQPLWAQTSYRVDDSATTTNQVITPMRWLAPSQAGGVSHFVQGQLQVHARLNLQAWLGRPNARIYMGLAPNAIPSLQVTWQTQGRFLNGYLRQSSSVLPRVLIYQGPINQAKFEEVLLLTLTADGRSYSQTQNLQFFFDIEP
jgi:hypothetical protein